MEQKISGSLEKLKRRRRFLAIGGLAVLIALVVYAALRPSAGERKLDRLRQDMIGLALERDGAIGSAPGKMVVNLSGSGKVRDPEKLKAIRETLKGLDPETRRQLTRDVLKARLEHARKETANLSEDQKKEMVQRMVQDVRERFSTMSAVQREKAAKDLGSEKGKREIKETMEFYFKEFSAKEQELMTPLVREVLINVDNL